MCRLMWMPPDPPFTRKEVEHICSYLENRQGGDGNGFYFPKGHYLTKSVDQKVYRLLRRGNWKGGFLFHTRKATTGSKTDANCHPFKLWRKWVGCHNGVWGDHVVVAPYHDGLTSQTDSEILLRHLILGHSAGGYGTCLVYTPDHEVWAYLSSSGSLVELKPKATKERIERFGIDKVTNYRFFASERTPHSIEIKDLAPQVVCIWPPGEKIEEASTRDWYEHYRGFYQYNRRRKKTHGYPKEVTCMWCNAANEIPDETHEYCHLCGANLITGRWH